MQDLLFEGFGLLRYEPSEMRVLVRHGNIVIADTIRAMLVWEPRRIVPTYAVPVADLRADLAPSTGEGMPTPDGVLYPGIPFAAHSADGEVVDVVAGDTRFAGAGFRLDDADLAEYVVLDFRAFDGWFGEDERLVSHPRDPYHRVDARQSSRTVRLELDGAVVAESSRPVFVFETGLPIRFYLPREDVRAELTPTDRRTTCAYKGHASYFSIPGQNNVAWTYLEPADGVTQLAGLIAFFDDRLDVFIDGDRREHPRTAVAEAVRQEFAPD
ncbi:uncharacterized protein (DUF427 family) [Kribbella steppae]|uniref:Uncharacterized protein (DUF427 family) n=2 Tax=Kribbella steppae TaxID=2512223 RepID=A0A4V2RY76_9ACTN|nr:uncharacterized protein (DUF427 family) [Kribbella steppae]